MVKLSVLASEFVNLILSSNFKNVFRCRSRKGACGHSREGEGGANERAALIYTHCHA